MDHIHLQLPWPPSVNRYWRNVSGRTILSAKGREFKKSASTAVRYRRYLYNCPLPLKGRLSVSVTLHSPTKARMDIDNRIKALLDALQYAGVFEDDGQVDRLSIVRGDTIKGGGVEVDVVEI